MRLTQLSFQDCRDFAYSLSCKAKDLKDDSALRLAAIAQTIISVGSVTCLLSSYESISSTRSQLSARNVPSTYYGMLRRGPAQNVIVLGSEAIPHSRMSMEILGSSRIRLELLT